MTSSNEEEKKGFKPVKQNATNKVSEIPLEIKNSSCHKYMPYLIGFTCIIALFALIIALYNLQSNKKLQINLIDKNTSLATKLEQIKQNQSTAQEQIDAKTRTVQEAQNDLQSKIDSLNKEIQTAMSQRLYQNQDWMMLKARYYLELAQINTHWSTNFNASISLLKQADKLLKQLNKPQIYNVRQAIAKEIALLKTAPTLDIAGLLSQLDAAQISVSKLTFQSTIGESQTKDNTESPLADNSSSWRNQLQNSMNLLGKLVVVRRNDEEIKPLMSPLFESILKESIQLNLQEAQWAALNNNPVVYQLSLKQATANLKRTFNSEAKDTAILIKQFNELQEVKITQEKPVIGLALTLLNQIIDNNELLENQDTNGGKGEN